MTGVQTCALPICPVLDARDLQPLVVVVEAGQIRLQAAVGQRVLGDRKSVV